jgi:hypothetical protein
MTGWGLNSLNGYPSTKKTLITNVFLDYLLRISNHVWQNFFMIKKIKLFNVSA